MFKGSFEVKAINISSRHKRPMSKKLRQKIKIRFPDTTHLMSSIKA